MSISTVATIGWRGSLVSTAAVVPTPIEYIKAAAAAAKKLVVGILPKLSVSFNE